MGPDGPEWRGVIPDRVIECQTGWRCQVCGELLPETATVVIDWEGRVLTDSAIHSGACTAMAFRFCPHLGEANVRAVEVTQKQIAVKQSTSLRRQGTPYYVWTVEGITDRGGLIGVRHVDGHVDAETQRAATQPSDEAMADI
jgi:hypothetical protein